MRYVVICLEISDDYTQEEEIDRAEITQEAFEEILETMAENNYDADTDEDEEDE